MVGGATSLISLEFLHLLLSHGVRGDLSSSGWVFLIHLLFCLLLLFLFVLSSSARSLQVVAEVKLGEGATAVAAGHLSASELHT